MATLVAVLGPHRALPGLKEIFRYIPQKEGAICWISKDHETGLALPHDHKVSRGTHAKVWYEKGQFWLSDAGSTNGTWIPEEAEPRPLRADERVPLDCMDEFLVGDTVVQLHCNDLKPDDFDRLREERTAEGIRDSLSLGRRVKGTEPPTLPRDDSSVQGID